MPNWLMDFFITKVCYQMLAIIQEKSKTVPSSIFGERIKQKPEFYGEVQKIIDMLIEEQEIEKKKQIEVGL